MNADNRLKESLPGLTDKIVDSYSHDNRIHHLGHCPLPRYEVIIQIIDDLKDLIYPGFRRREGLHIGNVSYHVGNLIDTLHDKLATQIARALLHADRVSGKSADECKEPQNYEAIGQKVAFEFLGKIPELRSVLATDVEAAFIGDPSVTNRDEIIFCFPGLEAVTIYRLAHELAKFHVPFIPRMMTEWAHKQTGIDIHPGAMIDKHFFIDHGTGVVIGETCEIGQHVRIYQGVTLGALSFATDGEGQLIRGTKRHPTIEDRVIIYANATILGGKTIVGHDSVIGSSVWITSTVAPHTTVVLEKPRLKMRGVVTAEPVELDFQI